MPRTMRRSMMAAMAWTVYEQVSDTINIRQPICDMGARNFNKYKFKATMICRHFLAMLHLEQSNYKTSLYSCFSDYGELRSEVAPSYVQKVNICQCKDLPS